MKKTYFLATAVAAVGLAMLTSVASAETPDATIFEAAGCDSEFLRPVLAGDGSVLYWQNTDGKGCEPSRKGGLRDDLANMPPVEEEPVDEEPTEEVASK